MGIDLRPGGRGFKDLLEHLGHELTTVYYGDDDNPSNVAIECEECGCVLVDFDSPEQERVKDGHFRSIDDQIKAEAWFREQAREQYDDEGTLEIDEFAPVSYGEPQHGAYVQAWVWVDSPEEWVKCDRCGLVYDEAKGDGYRGLCPKCADETEPCGECGRTPHDDNKSDITSIADHGRCVDCQKKWQHGELDEMPPAEPEE